MFKTVKVVILLAMMMAIVVMSSAKEPLNKVKPWKDGDKFYITNSFIVEYPAEKCANFSIDRMRKENRSAFAFFDKKINDANFGETIRPGDRKIIYIVRAVNSRKSYTACDMENFIQANNGQQASIAWLVLAYAQKWNSVVANRVFDQNTVCYCGGLKGKNGYSLIPYIGYDGSVALAAKEYPFQDADFIFMDDVPDAVASK